MELWPQRELLDASFPSLSFPICTIRPAGLECQWRLQGPHGIRSVTVGPQVGAGSHSFPHRPLHPPQPGPHSPLAVTEMPMAASRSTLRFLHLPSSMLYISTTFRGS